MDYYSSNNLMSQPFSMSSRYTNAVCSMQEALSTRTSNFQALFQAQGIVVIALTETSLTENIFDSELIGSGFTVFLR